MLTLLLLDQLMNESAAKIDELRKAIAENEAAMARMHVLVEQLRQRLGELEEPDQKPAHRTSALNDPNHLFPPREGWETINILRDMLLS
jgi:uncharacterized coiled-coil protein SlyX